MTSYNIKNQWGGTKAPWHDGGTWLMGGLPDQFLSFLQMSSADGGLNMKGFLSFGSGERMACRAEEVNINRYRVEACMNESKGIWENLGTWAIGSRYPQKVISLQVISEKGNNLTGTMSYDKEGPIGIEAIAVSGLRDL